MQQPDPIVNRPTRRVRGVALGVVGVVVAACGIAGGGGAAFASQDSVSTFSQLASAFGTSGETEIDVAAPISNPSGVITLYPGNTTILDLAGNEVDLQRIQLTTIDSSTNTVTGGTLQITDSVGGGLLKVDNSAATGPDASRAAIEVDADAGSSLTIAGASVTAKASTATSARAAAIGGGTWSGLSGASGSISISDYNGVHPTVVAVGSYGGAAIGDGGGAGGATISIGGHADVTATAPGSATTPGLAAAIGGGSDPQNGHTAGPSLTVDDYATVHATSFGAGAAIGGGRYGAGGSVMAQGQSRVFATGDSQTGQAGIGDGAMSASGRMTSVTTSGAAAIAATGGATGAAIGGGSSSYGGDSLTIGSGTSVTLSAANGVTAFGAPTGSSFGSLSNSGTLTLTGGSSITVPSGASISSDGTFVNAGTLNVSGTLSTTGTLSNTGAIAVASGGVLTTSGATSNPGTVTVSNGGTVTNTGTITNSGAVTGSGTFANNGSVVQNGTFSPSQITGFAYDIVYDGQGGQKSAGSQLVYADSASAAGVSLATATPPSSGSFTGWNASTGGDGAFLGGSDSIQGFSGSTANGSPAIVNVYAIYQIAPVLVDRSLVQGVVGTPYSATVAATGGTAPITYSKALGDLPAGLSLDATTGAISGTPTTAGTFTMTVGASNAYSRGHSAVTNTYTIVVVPTTITVSVPTTAKGGSYYFAGSTATMTITGLQANETYSVQIGGRTAATGKAASNSPFTLKVAVPKTIGDGSQTVSVSGGDHVSAGTARILTASVSKSLGLKLSAKKIKHGKKLTVTVSKLYAGENVTIVFSGKHSKTAVKTASSKGVATVSLSSLAKGSYTVKITGAGTSRKASAKLTVS